MYKGFKFIGMDLRLESLVLCGVLAFLVNFAAISVSEYLTASHFILLGGLIVVSAFVVTFYNRWLVKRRNPAAIPELEPEPALAVTEEEGAEIEEFMAAESSLAPAEPMIAVETVSQQSEDPIQEAAALLEPEDTESVEPGLEPAIEEPSLAAEGSVSVIPEEIPSEIIEEVTTESDESDDSISITEDEMNELGVDPEVDEPAIPSPEERYRRMVEEVSALETMDDILDYAYKQRSNDNCANAIYAYKYALERYWDDSYAPFVVIDLCNIYKANGFYSGAIEAYTEALDYPALQDDPAMQLAFRQSINYLKITEHLLDKAQTPGLPFSKIPDGLRQTIEQVYKLSNTH